MTRTSGPDATMPLMLVFNFGVHLATNAIPDAGLFMDGLFCTIDRAAVIQPNHDWAGSLLRTPGLSRVVTSNAGIVELIARTDEELVGRLSLVMGDELLRVGLVAAMPMAMVCGVDYEKVAARAAALSGKTVVAISGTDDRSDWLVGYERTLESLARSLPLAEGPRDPDAVAIVGYLHDRNEADHEANHAELARIIGGLGLRRVATWLGGEPSTELAAVARAGTIVSLPYGRKAARLLARRTGARLLETDLPFGMTATLRFVFDLALATDRLDQARAFVDAELAARIPRLEWLSPLVFRGRSVAYVGDPHLLPGFADICHTFGLRVSFVAVTNTPRHARDREVPVGPRSTLPAELKELAGLDAEGRPKSRDLPEPWHHPPYAGLEQRIVALEAAGELDALVSHSLAVPPRWPWVFEFGFPSYFSHALRARPFLGFEGAMWFIERLAEAVQRHDLVRRFG